jgi:HSP20 family protein
MALLQRWRPLTSTLDRWEPFRELGDLQTEVNRLFDRFFGRSARGGVTEAWSPAVDLWETNDEVVVAAELPGVREKEIQVTMTGDVLTIRGERAQQHEAQDGSFYRMERVFGKFERSIQLPIPVQADRVKATYRDGVLEVHLPKAEDVKPKEIKIDVR